MKIIDLHCDTVSYLAEQGASIFANQGQFDLCRAKDAGLMLQFFALFSMPADANRSLRQMMRQLEVYYSELDKNTEWAYPLISAEQLKQEENQNKLACLLHLEGGECLGTDIEILHLFYRMGLRSLGLTWNHRNQLADGVGEGSLAGGLSRQGRAVVTEMESLGILMDLAHLSLKGFYEVLDLYDPPVLVTHANAKAIFDHRRNLDDAQLRALSEHGGLIGITQVNDFISEAHASVDDMLDHIVYISEQIGVEHVALGSDFDGAEDMVLSNIGEYKLMPSLLANRGFSQAEIQLILSGNVLRIVEEVL